MTRRNVFVLGLDDLNREVLEALPGSDGLAFHRLFTHDELQLGDEIPLPRLLEDATRQLEAFDGEIDAIIGFWDFPVTTMTPILCRRFGLRWPPLEAVLRCEDKYWSRIEQAKVIDEVPAFALVDPDDPDAEPPGNVPYPFWLKPVKSFGSELAFRIEDRAGFDEALARIRPEIGRFGEPFDAVLSHADVPDEIARAGGRACIAEQEAVGEQITVEGFALDGEVHVYGTFDSISVPGRHTFERFQYPSRLPGHVTGRAAELSRRVIGAFGLEPGTFNIEYFWNPDDDSLSLLEVNPRHSQSHSRLTQEVDGIANHQVMIDLALGRTPTIPSREGPCGVAAKWFMKRFEDGVVTRAPSRQDVDRVRELVPTAAVELLVHEGDHLAEVHGHDAYSFPLAHVYVAGRDEDEVVERYERCRDELRFDFAGA